MEDNIYSRLDKIERALELFEKKVSVLPPENQTIENNNVESSMIAAYKYNPDTEILNLTFRTGMSYTYLNVPGDLINKFRRTDSHGKFFNENIKGKFPFAKEGEAFNSKEKKEEPKKVELLPLDLIIELKQFADVTMTNATSIKNYINELVKRIEVAQKRGM